MSRLFDLVGIGLSVYDSSFLVDRYPEVDTKVDALDAWHGGGGPVATALVMLARWGVRVAYAGRAGDDVRGEALREEFAAAGVDVSYFELDASMTTPHAAIWVEQGTGARTAVLGREHYSQPSKLPVALIDGAQILHFDGRDPELCAEAARRARKAGTEVSLDVGSPRLNVMTLLELTDHLVVAERFAHAATERTDPSAQLDGLWRAHLSALVITRGERGAVGRDRTDAVVRFGAYEVPTVDTTGAGDLYHAGYLYGALNGWGLARRMQFAAATAALATTALGARGKLPAVSEVEALIRDGLQIGER